MANNLLDQLGPQDQTPTSLQLITEVYHTLQLLNGAQILGLRPAKEATEAVNLLQVQDIVKAALAAAGQAVPADDPINQSLITELSNELDALDRRQTANLSTTSNTINQQLAALQQQLLDAVKPLITAGEVETRVNEAVEPFYTAEKATADHEDINRRIKALSADIAQLGAQLAAVAAAASGDKTAKVVAPVSTFDREALGKATADIEKLKTDVLTKLAIAAFTDRMGVIQKELDALAARPGPELYNQLVNRMGAVEAGKGDKTALDGALDAIALLELATRKTIQTLDPAQSRAWPKAEPGARWVIVRDGYLGNADNDKAVKVAGWDVLVADEANDPDADGYTLAAGAERFHVEHNPALRVDKRLDQVLKSLSGADQDLADRITALAHTVDAGIKPPTPLEPGDGVEIDYPPATKTGQRWQIVGKDGRIGGENGTRVRVGDIMTALRPSAGGDQAAVLEEMGEGGFDEIAYAISSRTEDNATTIEPGLTRLIKATEATGKPEDIARLDPWVVLTMPALLAWWLEAQKPLQKGIDDAIAATGQAGTITDALNKQLLIQAAQLFKAIQRNEEDQIVLPSGKSKITGTNRLWGPIQAVDQTITAWGLPATKKGSWGYFIPFEHDNDFHYVINVSRGEDGAGGRIMLDHHRFTLPVDPEPIDGVMLWVKEKLSESWLVVIKSDTVYDDKKSITARVRQLLGDDADSVLEVRQDRVPKE